VNERVNANESLEKAQERIFNRGKSTCSNGHPWQNATTRWRWRDRSHRKGHGSIGWERDCLVCKQVSAGTGGTGLRTTTWLKGATK
jgi:hypothetical protein